MTTSAEVHRRKIFAGTAMIMAPLALGAAYLLAPASSSDATAMVTALAEAGGRVEIASILLLAGLALFVFTAFGLVHLVREERPWLGQIGGVLTVVGLVFFAGVVGLFIATAELAQVDIAAAVTLMESVESNPAFLVGFLAAFAFDIGLVVLAVGLAQARTAPLWSAWLLAIGAILDATSGLMESTTVGVVGIAAIFLALAPLGFELIAEPDEAWEHPPRFEGFRPIGV